MPSVAKGLGASADICWKEKLGDRFPFPLPTPYPLMSLSSHQGLYIPASAISTIRQKARTPLPRPKNTRQESTLSFICSFSFDPFVFILQTFLAVSQNLHPGNWGRRGKLGRWGRTHVTKRPLCTNSSFVPTLPSLLMQPRGGGGPSPPWLPLPLPRSCLPAGSHPGPGAAAVPTLWSPARGQFSASPAAAAPAGPRPPTARPISLSLCFAARVPRGSRRGVPAGTCDAPQRGPDRGLTPASPCSPPR